MGDAEALVRFRGVQKTYDGQTLVVRDLDLDIRRGEFLTLLGPSGSGKTTSLMMLAGFEVPTQGDILLAGRSVRDTPPHKRDIGMVFQNYALFPHMTVAENVAFPLSVRGMLKSDQRDRALRALAMVRLENLGNRRPAQLSGGQQQRVALARALVFEPTLVLMDEPLGALDKQLREHMQIEIKHLHESLGLTVVYVTHDQSEALTMSDRVAVFSDGVIQQLDSPSGLYEQPRNSFVARFIGENNTLNGVVESVAEGYATVRLATGEALRARAVAIDGPGAKTSVSIRPERVHIEGEPEGPVSRLAGVVSETIYHGDHMRVRARVGGNDEFTIKMRYRAGRPIPKAGEALSVILGAEDCLALDPV
ncbi:ABC transporter ATP-binding protein [Rhodospirillum rubrum]|uniref:Spermidine/putrescine import ATP-binding protein PotA n=1 Tax=Rhodospirillum rubrum (strain ATCC 11170 / ATH 1.1.1 / DSM 467 / LMG 4362 / NCIMB 8255 / S1) TaxID=269796 RepID=Q2RSP7_RHORT|nr:ABC transporter ATP-binding protein [Rhodospirillum rubrum]ABC22848.1 ABC transporter component [Rhodospirillum rubrum ATCC 11170]AEO48571.1 ABC transporter protein [Rhodospirillum rubrum F11]MBK5954455.1 polyamine ABC transporter ATP-binding protein [Rhodospirillum rubrum]QXG78837.1 ABC transporter ATP-binding protein [Rhodospirillum rubrum]HAP99734.1 polyamine ABC transporter ATP-binding protein [Rhodospirillum rubrum]